MRMASSLTTIDENDFKIEINEKIEGAEHVGHVEQTKSLPFLKQLRSLKNNGAKKFL